VIFLSELDENLEASRSMAMSIQFGKLEESKSFNRRSQTGVEGNEEMRENATGKCARQNIVRSQAQNSGGHLFIVGALTEQVADFGKHQSDGKSQRIVFPLGK
jgi:hypothetical protein